MDTEVREAVQIVLDRMETHPEDFYDDLRINSRFAWVWNAVRPNTEYTYGLTDAEKSALVEGYQKIMYRKFHDRVLESLLNEPKQLELLEQQGSSLKPPTKLMPLTQGQMAVAKKLGLTAKEYAQATAPTFKT